MFDKLVSADVSCRFALVGCAVLAIVFSGCGDPSSESRPVSGEDTGSIDGGTRDADARDADARGADTRDADALDADPRDGDTRDGDTQPTLTDYHACRSDADCPAATGDCITDIPLNRAARDGRVSVAISDVFSEFDPGDGVCTRPCTDDASVCDRLPANRDQPASTPHSCQLVFSDVAPYPAQPPAFPFDDQIDLDDMQAGVAFGAICRPPLVAGDESSQSLCASCGSTADCADGSVCWSPGQGDPADGAPGHCLPECGSDADCATGFQCEAPSAGDTSVCVPIEGTCTECRDSDQDGIGDGRCGEGGAVTPHDCDDSNAAAYYDPDEMLHAFPDHCGEHDYNCNGLSDAAEQIGPQAFGAEHCTACNDPCGGDVSNGAFSCSEVADADGDTEPACTVSCDTDQNGDALFVDCNGPQAADGCETPVDDPDAQIYLDADGDGYGDPQSPLFQCPGQTVPDGFVDNNGDCDDTTDARAPNLAEMCDGLDNDCDGIVNNKPFSTVANPPSSPPYSGTAFITDDLIKETDPTAFAGLTYTGQGMRTMYDRRTASWRNLNAYLFSAQFGAATTVEVQVNPEFTQTNAETEALYYAEVIGRLPAFLFRDLDTVWIHKGQEPFGGGNDNLLIHTGQGEIYANNGELEEILIHEGAHTSMDPHHYTTRWSQAAAADGVALSTYAAANPSYEDIAESLGPYLAVRFRPGRVSAQTINTIDATIPNRIQFFDCLGLSMDIVQ